MISAPSRFSLSLLEVLLYLIHYSEFLLLISALMFKFSHLNAVFRKILKESEPVLKEALEKNPDFNLVVTGHSLGAGTAELITLNILTGKVDWIDPAKTNVKCISLAPPPVYRSTVKLPKEVKHKIEIYINNNDCVPRLSLGVIAKLLAMMKAVDSLPLTTYEQLQLLAGKSL